MKYRLKSRIYRRVYVYSLLHNDYYYMYITKKQMNKGDKPGKPIDYAGLRKFKILRINKRVALMLI